MAHMNQQKKAKIAAELKKVMPKGWKYTLAVRNHMTIVLTISEAPVDLIAEINRVQEQQPGWRGDYRVSGYTRLNPYYLERQFDQSLETFKQILAAMNTGNWDRSDIMSDYFDVGHYVDVNLGRHDKPFVNTGPKGPAIGDTVLVREKEVDACLTFNIDRTITITDIKGDRLVGVEMSCVRYHPITPARKEHLPLIGVPVTFPLSAVVQG